MAVVGRCGGTKTLRAGTPTITENRHVMLVREKESTARMNIVSDLDEKKKKKKKKRKSA